MDAFCTVLLERVRLVKRCATTADLTNRAVMAANMRWLYDAMTGSEQLLRDAAAESDDGALSDYYWTHLEEERGHVEWLREDLATADIKPGPPCRMAMAMVGTQHYLIKHVHPAALLGYLAMTEGEPVPLATVERLEQVYGAQLLRCIRYHATVDLEHRDEVFRMIAAMPQHHPVIEFSAENALGWLVAATEEWRRHGNA